MNMNKYEKEILDNKNLEAPDYDVLSKAKSAMPQKKNRVRLNVKQFWAIFSSCAIVIVVLICIPLMLPANTGMNFVNNMDLICEQIESIQSYNDCENADILYFKSNYKSNKYIYKGKTVLLEEFSSINDSEIVMLVKLNKNSDNSIFEKEEEYNEFLTYNQNYSVSDKTIYWNAVENQIYVYFAYENNTYYIKISDNINDWQNLLNEFLF